jgi:hypothetical protein
MSNNDVMLTIEVAQDIVKDLVRFEVFTADTVKNAVYWDKKPSSYLTGKTLCLR